MFYVRKYIELIGFIKAREVIISKLYFSRPENLQRKLKMAKKLFQRIVVTFFQ